jgi:hypothetical protein
LGLCALGHIKFEFQVSFGDLGDNAQSAKIHPIRPAGFSTNVYNENLLRGFLAEQREFLPSKFMLVMRGVELWSL